jgi:hypothetical protein
MERNPIAVLLCTVIALAACARPPGGSRSSPVGVRVEAVTPARAVTSTRDVTPDTIERVEVSSTYVAGA